jgi:DNA-binding winged helix-turn-helix (wHTH) protein
MTIHFAEWTLDRETRELRRGREAVHLSTKAFDLLALLVDARPRVLSKAALQEALWPDVFVSEANLFTLISEIRTALGDEARQARFVRTVHGVGYAFSGEAQEEERLRTPRVRRASIFSIAYGDRQVRLSEGENVLGRDADVAVCLDSATVSRRHARIVIAGESARLEDLGSKNGTYLNAARVEAPSPLRSGDQIRVGAIVCSFRAARPTTATETHEAL